MMFITSDWFACARRLVDDDEVRIAEALRQGPGPDDAADIRRYDDHLAVFLSPGIAEQNWRGIDVVDGDVEKALDLVRMQINRQHSVDAGRRDQLGDQLGGYRNTRRPRPAILPRESEIRDYRSNRRGRGTFGRVDHHQQFHQVLGRRWARRLHDKGLAAANILENFDVDFAVGKSPYMSLREWDT